MKTSLCESLLPLSDRPGLLQRAWWTGAASSGSSPAGRWSLPVREKHMSSNQGAKPAVQDQCVIYPSILWGPHPPDCYSRPVYFSWSHSLDPSWSRAPGRPAAPAWPWCCWGGRRRAAILRYITKRRKTTQRRRKKRGEVELHLPPGPVLWVQASLDRCVLCRQSESIPAHRVQHLRSGVRGQIHLIF